jgi:hypothetical protein
MPVIDGGYYLIARCIRYSEIAHAPPHVREIWDWFLYKAQFQEKRGISRGQLICSYKDIQEALHWKVGYRKEMYSKTNCQVAIRWFKKREMIISKKVSDGLKITILNYDLYQNPKNYENLMTDTTESATEVITESATEVITESTASMEEESTVAENRVESFENETHNETGNEIHNGSTTNPQEIHNESTPIYNKNGKKVKKVKKLYVENSFEFRLSQLLWEYTLRNNPDAKEPDFQKWAKGFDSILRIDKREFKDVEAKISWAQNNDFYHSVILTPISLRKHYDILTLKMKQNRNFNNNLPTPTPVPKEQTFEVH